MPTLTDLKAHALDKALEYPMFKEEIYKMVDEAQENIENGYKITQECILTIKRIDNFVMEKAFWD